MKKGIVTILRQLRLYQVGNTSSRKITVVKQLGPRLALGWVTIQELNWRCSHKYCKNPRSGETGPPKIASGQKKKRKKKKEKKLPLFGNR